MEGTQQIAIPNETRNISAHDQNTVYGKCIDIDDDILVRLVEYIWIRSVAT